METSFFSFYLFITLVILLPIIPAFLFYKIIPTQRTDVNGKFSGLSFKLSGAFGGYFLMVFLLIYSFKGEVEGPNSCEVWLVEANVEFINGEGSTSQLQLQVDPPTDQSYGDKLRIKVLKEPGHDGAKVFPIIKVMHENFKPSFIEISDSDDIDYKHKTVLIKDIVTLKREPL